MKQNEENTEEKSGTRGREHSRLNSCHWKMKEKPMTTQPIFKMVWHYGLVIIPLAKSSENYREEIQWFLILLIKLSFLSKICCCFYFLYTQFVFAVFLNTVYNILGFIRTFAVIFCSCWIFLFASPCSPLSDPLGSPMSSLPLSCQILFIVCFSPFHPLGF